MEKLLKELQNRTLNDSTLLSGHGEFMMDVSCVEQNRWSSTYGKFNYSDDLHNFRAKGNKMFYVNESKINTGRKHSNRLKYGRIFKKSKEI